MPYPGQPKEQSTLQIEHNTARSGVVDQKARARTLIQRTRISLACSRCRKLKRRCSGNSGQVCESCIRSGVPDQCYRRRSSTQIKSIIEYNERAKHPIPDNSVQHISTSTLHQANLVATTDTNNNGINTILDWNLYWNQYVMGNISMNYPIQPQPSTNLDIKEAPFIIPFKSTELSIVSEAGE